MFRNKPGVLVADYIGFVGSLINTIERDKENTGVDTALAEIMQEKYELLQNYFTTMTTKRFTP